MPESGCRMLDARSRNIRTVGGDWNRFLLGFLAAVRLVGN